MADKEHLNGSVDLLASAMRSVFTECMDSVRNGMRADLRDMEGRLNKRIDGLVDRVDGLEKRLDTTDANMAAQFADQEKKIGEIVEKKLDRLSQNG